MAASAAPVLCCWHSSGKTFTMFGSDEVSATSLGADCARHDVDEEKMCRTAGLVPRAMAELMGAVESRKRQGVEMTLRCALKHRKGTPSHSPQRASVVLCCGGRDQ